MKARVCSANFPNELAITGPCEEPPAALNANAENITLLVIFPLFPLRVSLLPRVRSQVEVRVRGALPYKLFRCLCCVVGH